MTLNLQPSPSLSQPDSASCSSDASVASLLASPHDSDPASILPIPQAMPPPKPTPRARVPLEKGYSQMVWLRLLQTAPDLAGLKGQSPKRLIPMQEVKQHKTEEDAWTVLRGRVYNISPYIRFHPGGKDMLMKGAGRDCTALFSILTLVFRKIVLWYSLECFVSPVAVSLAWKDPMSSYSRSIAFLEAPIPLCWECAFGLNPRLWQTSIMHG